MSVARIGGPKTGGADSAVRERIRGLAEQIAAAAGMDVVDVDFVGSGRQRLLRVFLDKPAGITHGDCESVSRQLSAVLDAEEVIPEGISYVLEVSSPGLERRLVKREDFQRFAGQRVRLQLRSAPGRPRRRVTGVLEGWFDDRVRIRQPESGEVWDFAPDEVERANLAPSW